MKALIGNRVRMADARLIRRNVQLSAANDLLTQQVAHLTAALGQDRAAVVLLNASLRMQVTELTARLVRASLNGWQAGRRAGRLQVQLDKANAQLHERPAANAEQVFP